MVVVLIAIVLPLSIILSELDFWRLMQRLMHMKRIWDLIFVFTPALELLMIYKCVILYRKFNNPFFKFIGIALGVSVVGNVLWLVRTNFFAGMGFYLYGDLPVAFGLVSSVMATVFRIAEPLLILYALLVYKESAGQNEATSPLKKLFLLLPAAGGKRFWFLIIGIPVAVNVSVFVLTLVFLQDYATTILTGLLAQILFSINMSAQFLGLLLSQALGRVYGNNLFKYLFATYIIHLIVPAVAYLSVFPVILRENGPLPITGIYNQLQSYTIMISHIAVPALLLFAVFTYRERCTGNIRET